MFSLRSYVPWAAPLTAGLLVLGGVPDDLPGDSVRAGPVRDDFDGDGYRDLVITAPFADVTERDAGYVAVLYGGPDGPAMSGRTVVISRGTEGIPGQPGESERFGSAPFKGDLDGDGYADLVLGGTWKTQDAVVVWGGPGGLTTAGATSVPGNTPVPGDFDGDGELDLALFRSSQFAVDDAPFGSTGKVWYGPISRSGIPARETGFPDKLKRFDVYSGAAGDLNADGRDDLTLSGDCGAGDSDHHFCYPLYLGAKSGFTKASAGFFRAGTAQGDINGDGYLDFVSSRSTGDGEGEGGGLGTIAFGTADGPSPRSTWTSIDEAVRGTPAEAMLDKHSIASVAVGDITGDGMAEVALGVFGEEREGAEPEDTSGAVVILRGGLGGLTGTGAQRITEDTPGVPGGVEDYDHFGVGLRVLDLDGNGFGDLSVGAWREDDGDGRAYVLRGGPEGVVTEGAGPDAVLTLDAKSVGAPNEGAHFGSALK
ncbi:FG-GAP-like repeat-containing protein [Streptomyces sp. NPDC046909]|uniref:FG-GAP-like repeat-containing protein n=1 Tax=Streptomyces sp. NPDC046909 TaxID=3155617 RepID=UPI0033C260D3